MIRLIRKSAISNLGLTGAIAIMAACWSNSALALDLPDLPDFKGVPLSGSYYGGLGFGTSGIEPEVNNSGFEVTDSVGNGVQLFIGRDISPRISVEGYLSQLGEAHVDNFGTGDSGSVEYTTLGASGLLYLFGGSGKKSFATRSGFSVYGRLGIGRINNSGVGVDFNRSSPWNVSGGMGAEYNLKNGFGLRAEFQSFDSDARVVSFNVVKRFRIERQNGRLKFKGRSEDLVLVEASSKSPRLAKKDSDGDGVSDYIDDCNSTGEGKLVGTNGCEFTGVLEGVTFSSGSSKLTNPGTNALDQVVSALNKNSDVSVSIQAHTDNRGPAEKNMALSRKRAESVVRYLVESGSIDLKRISAIGYGESRPLKTNQTAEGRTANRRVEIKVTE